MMGTLILAGFYVFDNLSFAIFTFVQAVELSIIVFGLVASVILFVVKLIRAYKFINNDITINSKENVMNRRDKKMTIELTDNIPENDDDEDTARPKDYRE